MVFISILISSIQLGWSWKKKAYRCTNYRRQAQRVEADQALYDAIIGKTIRHYNDPVLNEHVKNAVAIETPRGFRLAKEKTSRKIDASVALSMAHYGALNNKITWWMT